MKRVSIFPLASASAAAVAGLLLASCGEPKKEAETPAKESTPVAVATAIAAIEQWPSAYEATGTVRARSSTTVAAKWMGYVREVKVQLGDRVQQGQSLAVLDTRDLDTAVSRAAAGQAQVRSAIPEADGAIAMANAHLDLVQSTHRRLRELYDKKSISDQEWDEANAKLKAAQSELAIAKARRAQLDDKLAQADQEMKAAQVTRTYAEIQSPVAGTITSKSVEPGNLAAPGAPLFVIETGGFRLEASVEEEKIGSVRTGTAATIHLDGIDRAIEGRVAEIVPSIDPSSRSFLAKIELPPLAGLRTGLFGRAEFSSGTRQVLTIPAAALIERGQLQSVFVANSGEARTRLVTAGARKTDHVEVLSGLNSGEAVIVPVPPGLSDGSKIEVRPNEVRP